MSDLRANNHDWFADKGSQLVFDKIKELCDSGVMRSNHRKRIGLDMDGRLTIDSIVIPHSLLSHFFACAYAIKSINSKESKKFPFKGIKYDIITNGQLLSLIEHRDGFKELYLDESLHCLNGPARYNAADNVQEYYVYGKLHREEGPAQNTEDKRIYALDGERLSLLEFIQANPLSEKITRFRGNGKYTIYKWQEYAVVCGLDNTTALLRKHSGAVEEDGLIIEAISENLDDYQVLYYNEMGNVGGPMYTFIRSLGRWDHNSAEDSFREIESQTDDSVTTLHYSRDTNELAVQSSVFNETFDIRIDLSFNKDIVKSILPDVFVKRDRYGRKHCIDGPAVLTPSGKSQYHLHGVHITQEAFDSASLEKKTGMLYWTDEQGQFHNNNWLPAKILPTGESHYYHHGLLHSDIFPAIEIPGDGFHLGVYYLYGNEVSAEEFSNFRPEPREISFWKDGKLHRKDAPARIRFSEDGSNIKEYWSNGQQLAFVSDQIPKNPLVAVARQDNSNMTIPKLILKTDKLGNPSLKDKIEQEKGAKMNVKFIRPGASNSNAGDSRKDQIFSGAKLGAKKGVIRVASEKASAALASHLPMSDSIAMKRLVQLSLLLVSAELVERLPGGVGDKIGLDQSRRESFSGLSRFVSGEVLGRDAVNIVTTLAPTLLDALKQLSTSDIAEAAQSMTVQEAQYAEVTAG